MQFHIDPSNGVPIFRQLMDQVKLSIATGALKFGDELPSIRSLSVPLGVNPMTISKAYNLLVHEGVLERRPGLPLVVAAVDGPQMNERRSDQLKKSLGEAVNLVHTLEFNQEEAVDLFRNMLREILQDGEPDDQSDDQSNHPSNQEEN